MTGELAGLLARQHEIAWRLAAYHLETLGTDECLWRPANRGLHVSRTADGQWRADWPEHEGYDAGPPSIAWLTWHIGYWWMMVLDHTFGQGTLDRTGVVWPGTADGVRAWLTSLHEEWSGRLSRMTDEELMSGEHTRWPFKGRPFADVSAWLDIELAKNAAEIGYARFLHAGGAPAPV